MTAGPVEGEWVTQTELARIKGVSPQAVSKRWNRLKAAGEIEVVRWRGHDRVRLAEWDVVIGETADPAKLLGMQMTDGSEAGAGDDDASSDPSYQRERTRQARYAADLKEIELRRLRGELLEASEVGEAMTRCAEMLARDLDQLPAHADELAAAMSRAGVPGLRDALRDLSRRHRATLSKSLRLLATGGTGEEEAP